LPLGQCIGRRAKPTVVSGRKAAGDARFAANGLVRAGRNPCTVLIFVLNFVVFRAWVYTQIFGTLLATRNKQEETGMSRARWSTTIALLVLIVAMVPANGSAQAAATQQLSKKELKTLIANARTPEDHERIAAYYRTEGEQLKAKQREHEEELSEYLKNPSSHPVPKWPTMDQHCRQLIFYYSKAAQSAFELAELHDQMAKQVKRH
jgi:hypothetical protein